MELRDLQFELKDNISLATLDTVIKLEKLLRDRSYTAYRSSYFLYRLAVEILAEIIGRHPQSSLRKEACFRLKNILIKDQSQIAISTAEALSNLPLGIKGPETNFDFELFYVSTDEILNKLKKCTFYKTEGRNLIFKKEDKLFVIKLEKNKEKALSLKKEIFWMLFLNDQKHLFQDFKIPIPLDLKGKYFFFLKDKGCYAISYIADKDYFRYPNHPPLPSKKEFLEILSKAAFLFGRLISYGILHTDPIPLFHNRTESHRRDDRGLYLWTRGGRLDRWLSSCMYPNFAKSGIRDFEHLLSFSGSNRELFRFIGNHFLAMFLVLGSYFRAKEPKKIGFDKNKKPFDVRYLFDKDFMKKAVLKIFQSYFEGFVGETIDVSLDVDHLVDRMIDEFGVDRYMEELFRVEDQLNMSDAEFKTFLKRVGYSAEEVNRMKKGEKDIPIYTGPHLGEFNGRISIPELLEFTAVCTAICMLYKALKLLTNTNPLE